jgi:ribonuclease BN (tRNA processing enzyme)
VKVHILGSSVGGQVSQQYAISYLVNDVVAIDAGCLGFAWPLQVQRDVKHVFLSHSHIDHIASLPLFLENVYEPGPDCPEIHGNASVGDCLKQDVFNNRVWPDFIQLGEVETPFLDFQLMEDGDQVRVGDLSITAVSVDHIVPTLGFIVEDDQSAVVFGCDSGPTDRIWELANQNPKLKAVYLEASFPNSMEWLAKVSKHLTPEMFLAEYRKLNTQVTVIAIHIKAAFRDQVISELRALNLPQLEIGTADRPYYH